MSSNKITGWFRATAMVASVSAALITGGTAKAENLADAMIGAYNSSGLLEQNRALLRAADEDVAAAISTLRPILDFVISVSANEPRSWGGGLRTTRTSQFTAGFEATMRLFDNGVRRMGVAAAKEVVLATRQTLVSIEQQILFRAVQAFMNVLLQTENVSLRQNNVRVLGEELRAAQDRFDVGEVTRTDVALAESRLAAARSNLAEARGLLANARAEYKNAVGREPGQLVTPTNLPKKPASVEAAQAVAVRYHPNVLSAQRTVAARELQIRQAEQALGPVLDSSLNFGITENWDTTSDGYNTSLGLELTQPLYSGGGLQADIRAAMADRDAARSNLLTVQRDTVQGVNDAYVRLEVARAAIASTVEQVRASQVAFDGIREEATLGARTTLDVLTAEQNLLDALTAQISARAEGGYCGPTSFLRAKGC